VNAVRPALLSTGMLLIVLALRTLARSRHPPSASGAAGASGQPLARIAGVALWHAARLARRTGMCRHRTDATDLWTRLAVAPRCWPARFVTTAARGRAVSLNLVDAEPGLSGARDGACLPRGGRRAPNLVDLLCGVRLCSAFALGLLGAACWPLLGPPASAALATISAAAGTVLPDLALNRAARSAARSASRDVATAVDVLAAATVAGLGLRAALDLAAAHAPPPVAAALRASAVRLATGADPQAALATEANRFCLPALSDAGAAVDRQRRLGTALGAELRGIATRLRAEQRVQTLERAARRGPLGTLVVALVIAPVCLAALTACLVGGLVESGGLPIH